MGGVLLQTYPNPLQTNPAYSVVKYVKFFNKNDLSFFQFNTVTLYDLNFFRQYFVNEGDTVAQKVTHHR